MRILVYPHDLGMGGSQLNAIEIGAAVRDLGHEVIVYGQPGVLCERVAELGLEFVASPRSRRRPTPSIVRDLRRLVAQRGIHLVHGYEWPPILEAYLAAGAGHTVGTVMSMSVPSFIPPHVPLVVGTAQIANQARRAGARNTRLIEPPVDVVADAPDRGGQGEDFRAAWNIPFDATVVTCVSRLATELKREGILTAIEVVPHLADDVVLVVVGDGPAAEQVRRAAQRCNEQLGRAAVVLTGEVMDPRGAYAAADVAIGMGGSALRAMAFAKPLIVQGEAGFWKALTPDSRDGFLWTGWYGIGQGSSTGAARLTEELTPLLRDSARRMEMGRFGRALVEERFSLQAAAARQVEIYQKSLARPPTRRGRRIEVLTAAARFADYLSRRAISKRFGRAALDDFNAVAAASNLVDAPEGVATAPNLKHPRNCGPLLVYVAGVHFDAVQGTDHRLVEELAAHYRVMWVDPPTPVTKLVARGGSQVPPGLREIAPNTWRLTTWVPPGVTRPVLRSIAVACEAAALRLACMRLGARVSHAVVADPLFPVSLLGSAWTVLLVTDDTVAGANLLGLPTNYVRAIRDANVLSSDAVVTVSQELADRLRVPGVDPVVLPNGCSPEVFRRARPARGKGPDDACSVRQARASLVGQLNERLDVALLWAIVGAGVELLVVGPRHERDPRVRAELDALLTHPRVTWYDQVPLAEVARHLSTARVGLTPYLLDGFNLASFPLKTLDYLAAGIPAVTTDLPASRWLDTPVVNVATTHSEFVELVQRFVTIDPSPETFRECLRVAEANSWWSRAQELARIAGLCDDPHCPNTVEE